MTGIPGRGYVVTDRGSNYSIDRKMTGSELLTMLKTINEIEQHGGLSDTMKKIRDEVELKLAAACLPQETTGHNGCGQL